jgi:hypothetical protein
MPAKSVSEKLLIGPGTTLWSSQPSRVDLIAPLPEGVERVVTLGDATTALVFADDSDSLRKVLHARRDELGAPNGLWIVYPKANRTDINRDTLWPILAEYGMRPISQVAIDEVWSALRFRPLRDGEPPFAPGR